MAADVISWISLGGNIMVGAYVAGIMAQRVASLEKRMDSKSSKDDVRDTLLTDIRMNLVQLNQKLDQLSARRIGFW